MLDQCTSWIQMASPSKCFYLRVGSHMQSGGGFNFFLTKRKLKGLSPLFKRMIEPLPVVHTKISQKGWIVSPIVFVEFTLSLSHLKPVGMQRRRGTTREWRYFNLPDVFPLSLGQIVNWMNSKYRDSIPFYLNLWTYYFTEHFSPEGRESGGNYCACHKHDLSWPLLLFLGIESHCRPDMRLGWSFPLHLLCAPIIYILHFSHLADALIQSDLQ